MITFDGMEWPIIRQFDCRVISVEGKSGGGWFTCLPISPTEYRRKHPTKARVAVSRGETDTVFHITDDWGHLHKVTLSNDMQEEIKAATAAAVSQGLMEDTTP
jgi:hypothetical protein